MGDVVVLTDICETCQRNSAGRPKRINLRYESGLYICNQVVVYSL